MNTIIEKIRAEIERRITDNTFGAKLELIDILAWLDTLEEQPLLSGFENEQPGIPGKDFVPVAWCDALEQYGIWRIERVEQPVCEGLEEETEKFIETFGWGKTKHIAEKELISATARHFAQWQKQHDAELIEIAYNDGLTIGMTKQKEQMMKEAIHYVVQDDLDSHGASYNIPFIRIGTTALKPKGIGVGDKVRIVIVKEDEK